MEGPRSVCVEEFANLMRLVNLVFRGNEVPSVSMEEELPLLFNRDNLNHLYIIKDGQQIVTHVGAVLNKLIIHGAKITIASIGAVCTHPDYRGKGYASRLLHHCVRELKEAGARLVVISGDRDLYRRANCYPAGEIYQYKITKGGLENLKATGVEIQPLKGSDLDTIISIHEQEPVRFHRTAKAFEKLISVPSNWMKGIRDGFIIHNGEPVAYLFLFRKAAGDREGTVWEFSGEREALTHAIPSLFEHYQLDTLTLYVNVYDHRFVQVLTGKNLNAKKCTISGHSLGVINFTGLIEELRPYFEEYLSIEPPQAFMKKDQYVLSVFGEEYIIENQADLVHFLFGPQWEKTRLTKGPAVLRDVLKKAFPIPIPWPGLNFV